MNVRKIFIISSVSVILLASGCAPELQGVCESNAECIDKYLCNKKNQCVEVDQKNIEILTNSLDDAILGKEYRFALKVIGGLKPYSWIVSSDLKWLSVQENDQTNDWELIGIPTNIQEAAVVVGLHVTDDSISNGQTQSKDLSIKVVYCNADIEGDQSCSGKGTCIQEKRCVCNTGYTGHQCEKCDEENGYQRNDEKECVRFEYKCEPTDKCGASAYRRECVSEPCDEPWDLIDQCGASFACKSNDQGAGCVDCGQFGCTNGKCNGCSAGLCCDNGQIRDEGDICMRWTEYQCSLPLSCGSDGQERILVTKCNGTTAGCDGATEEEKPWTNLSDRLCENNQICNATGGAYPECKTCENGCGNAACFPDCNPSENSCCTAQGEFNNYCWHDTKMNLVWQNPPSTSADFWSEAVTYCDNLILGSKSNWRLPTISELRSLIRGCAKTQVTDSSNGTCGVIDSCLSQSCRSDECYGCPESVGPGTDDCFWDPAIKGACVKHWSSSEDPEDWMMVWIVYFNHNGSVSRYDKGAKHEIRCVRDGP